ncbi:aspartyl/asparaginyl beta-hydroxylase domain-containing protein [Methylobacterium frigidaeris]|uniref:L-proline cis-4-hydroxylase n=1 Tax=Methylobacterium frigidaeris TaxID=2038277 RepID=A0AA37HF27_9HYPH|nr:aspartyl/asparaginyl beta-hydroxylase domain-containing protein [Methylobacterium frigidaeris]GJD64573.1 L-proline cis-4-hydroxylase [Methylobacterium frigidaeris]
MVWSPGLDLEAVPESLRLPLAFDAAAMAAECAALAGGDWIDHFVRSNYDGDWSVIPLRAKADARHPVMMIQSDPVARDYVDTPFLAACPAIRAALAQFGCPLLSVRLMRLGPGSRIKEHRDHDLSFEEGAVRLHVPLVTHDGVVFTLNRRRVVMAAGSCWYLRLSDPHAVENPGPGERVHLVVDAQVTPALAALFATALEAAA